MPPSIVPSLARSGVLALGAMALLASPAWAARPFASFAGRWVGGGDIAMADGSREAIRCKANYTENPAGDALTIKVDCASDSYRVTIVSQVAVAGSALSGTWQETTRGVEGSINGHMPGPGAFQAKLDGLGFDIGLSASTDGRRQSVRITSGGTDIQAASISLRRG